MLRGWHGHNGVSLAPTPWPLRHRNDRWPTRLVGHIEEGHDLDPDDRVRFHPGSVRRGLPQICPSLLGPRSLSES